MLSPCRACQAQSQVITASSTPSMCPCTHHVCLHPAPHPLCGSCAQQAACRFTAHMAGRPGHPSRSARHHLPLPPWVLTNAPLSSLHRHAHLPHAYPCFRCTPHACALSNIDHFDDTSIYGIINIHMCHHGCAQFPLLAERMSRYWLLWKQCQSNHPHPCGAAPQVEERVGAALGSEAVRLELGARLERERRAMEEQVGGWGGGW